MSCQCSRRQEGTLGKTNCMGWKIATIQNKKKEICHKKGNYLK